MKKRQAELDENQTNLWGGLREPVTLEEILKARTGSGGWTKSQILLWGVPWPLTAGWIDRLLEKERT